MVRRVQKALLALAYTKWERSIVETEKQGTYIEILYPQDDHAHHNCKRKIQRGRQRGGTKLANLDSPGNGL